MNRSHSQPLQARKWLLPILGICTFQKCHKEQLVHSLCSCSPCAAQVNNTKFKRSIDSISIRQDLWCMSNLLTWRQGPSLESSLPSKAHGCGPKIDKRKRSKKSVEHKPWACKGWQWCIQKEGHCPPFPLLLNRAVAPLLPNFSNGHTQHVCDTHATLMTLEHPGLWSKGWTVENAATGLLRHVQ